MAEQADMSTDGVIEAFEAWAAENNVDTQLWPLTGGYLNSRTADFWTGWLAAVTSPWLREGLAHRASPWQPIETAPRDGTRVLLVTTQGVQFVGKYTDAESRFPWHSDYTDTYLAEARLSGWQPLPAAPEVRND